DTHTFCDQLLFHALLHRTLSQGGKKCHLNPSFQCVLTQTHTHILVKAQLHIRLNTHTHTHTHTVSPTHQGPSTAHHHALQLGYAFLLRSVFVIISPTSSLCPLSPLCACVHTHPTAVRFDRGCALLQPDDII